MGVYASTIIILLSTVSCFHSDNKSGSTSDPVLPAFGRIFGIGFDGLIQMHSVSVFEYSNAPNGVWITSQQANQDGFFNIRTRYDSVPVKLVLRGGSYVEEADGVLITLDDTHRLFAVDQFPTGTSAAMNITFLTTIAAGYAEYRVSQGDDVTLAIRNANSLVNDLVGFNILTTDPKDVMSADNATTVVSDNIKYGFYAAGISQWTKDTGIKNMSSVLREAPYNSISFIQIAYRDIKADGKLDGFDENGVLFFGITMVDSNTYRHGIAKSILAMAVNSLQLTGLNQENLLPFSVLINDSTNPLFDNTTPIIPIDEGGPIIKNFLPADGTVILGDSQLSAEIEDIVGIPVGATGIVEFLIDDVHYSYSGGHTPASNFTISVFQAAGTMGTHTLTIKVKNNVGSVSTQTNTVTFDNR